MPLKVIISAIILLLAIFVCIRTVTERWQPSCLVQREGWTAIGIRCTHLWNYVELFWKSLDNAPSSIVFYLEMKGEVEVGVHDIRSWFTPRLKVHCLGWHLHAQHNQPAWNIFWKSSMWSQQAKNQQDRTSFKLEAEQASKKQVAEKFSCEAGLRYLRSTKEIPKTKVKL